MISYKKLFLLMEEQEITKEKLKNKIGISSATMAKLSKNEDVSMSTIQSLCDFFDCQPGAILSYEKEIDKNTTLFRLREEMEMKLKGGLYHQTQIRIAYNSNHMEGSRLTHDQTRYIFETNTIGVENEVLNVDDVIETANHFRCKDFICRGKCPYLTGISIVLSVIAECVQIIDKTDDPVLFQELQPFQQTDF